MSTTYLLDANVLIAHTIPEHEQFERVSAWIAGIEHVALSPIVEGALVRFVLRIGQSHEMARRLLARTYADPRCVFWPDSVSYASADLGHLRGHRQVTDAYLAALAASNHGMLATLDEPLARTIPDSVHLVPAD